MPRIVKVESNIKVGCNNEISEKTIIVGRNGSGKSTLTNAIELALTGRVSDIAGRADVGQEVSLMALAPKGADVLWAKVTFDDGSVASYKTEGSTAKAKKATKNVPAFAVHPEIFPLRSMREAVLGSAQTARKFLVSKAIKVTMDEVREMIPQHSRKMFDNMVNAIGPTDSPADTLVAVLEKAGSKQRECAKEVSAFETVSNTYAGGIMSPPTRDEISQAESDWNAAVQKAASLKAKTVSTTMTSNLAYWQKKYDELLAKQDYVVDELTRARAAKAALKEPKLPLDGLDSAMKVIEVSKELGSCLACGSEDVGSLDERKEVMAASLFQYDHDLQVKARTENWLTQAELAAERFLSDFTSAEDQLSRAKAAVEEIGSGPSAEEIDAADKISESMKKTFLELKSQKEAWDAAERARAGAVRKPRRPTPRERGHHAPGRYFADTVGIIPDNCIAARGVNCNAFREVE